MLSIHFLNVSNGDCIVVEYINEDGEKEFGIIDSNRTSNSASPGLAKLLALGAEHLSFVCITHPDRDHYSGMHDVLVRFRGRISEFYTCPMGDLIAHRDRLKKLAKQYRTLADRQDDPDVTRASLEFVQILKFADEEFFPDRWYELTGYYNRVAPPGFTGVEIHCLLPPSKVKGRYFQQIEEESVDLEGDISANQLSIAFRITFAGAEIILGGDGSRENWFDHRRWQRKSGQDIRSGFVKLPHHGSKRDCDPDTTGNLFTSDWPMIGVISADGKSHPHIEVIDRLMSAGVKPYCTNLQSLYRESNRLTVAAPLGSV